VTQFLAGMAAAQTGGRRYFNEFDTLRVGEAGSGTLSCILAYIA
jgi:hypothetical protein